MQDRNETAKPRICMPVFSGFANHAYRTGMREAQDVLCSCEDVDQIELTPKTNFSSREKWVNKLTYHDLTRFSISRNPGLTPIKLKNDYDALVLVCPYWRDVIYVNAISNWKEHCKISICWIDELWIKDLSELNLWLRILDQFDYIFIGIDGTATHLEEKIGQRCQSLPGGVDTLRFMPSSETSEKCIDVYSIGRRVASVHESLLNMVESEGIFYLHDTLSSGDSMAFDHVSHRNMFANIAKRSRIFMTAPGKFDTEDQTNGQIDIGFRCFEGAAAGAVLVGQRPEKPIFQEMFWWDNAVVSIDPDGSDTQTVIKNLLSDEEELDRIGRTNVKNALENFDWVYRWRTIYDIAGLEIPVRMRERIDLLKDLSAQVTCSP